MGVRPDAPTIEAIVSQTSYEIIILLGFVKSPSVLFTAGLRFNPAPLDNNPDLAIQGYSP